MKIGKVYAVDWIDSANHAIGWEHEVNTELATICAIGFLTSKSKKGITLVQNVCYDGPGEGSQCNAISIPRGCIKSITRLKVKKCRY